MIECIFTIDYEIYGNGKGSLKELAFEPAERLMAILRKDKTRLVIFVEVAELEMMEANGADPAIDMAKTQIRDFHKEGVELGLHFHPWWYNARYEKGSWLLDYSEYHLCTLTEKRITQIIDRSIAYFRTILGLADFTPLSFRSGDLLFQPTQTVAKVLAERGIKVDSSVYKGGVQHQHKLDYRRALRNGYYWMFANQVEVPDPDGRLLELPIYTQMVPTWKMFTTKRVGLQRKISSGTRTGKNRLYRLMDLLRPRHPLKLDFCRMTISELTRMMDTVIREDQREPTIYRPIVTIGHTKDLIDFETVELFLSYLGGKGIPIRTFGEILPKCN